MSKAVKAIKKVVKKVASVVTGGKKEVPGAPKIPGQKVASKADEAAKARAEQNAFSRRAGSSRRRTILSSENLG